ncbi:hypothetical protein H4R24_005579 [Coemansia sp. RSA 988]|nr:hypothetical protein H4R24_005579 [Coemansia sp. RSA 988]
MATRSTGPLATPVPAATAVALGGEYPASECDWSLSSIYKKPRSFRRIHLPCPVEYYNRVAANMSLERLAGVGGSHKRRLPRTPSSKIAVLSGVDLLMHIMWIVNTSAAQSSAGCTATLFLFQWVQLFYMFYLASFAFSSLMRLRNMQASRQQHQKRTDTIVAVSIGGASFLLSLLPAVMTSAHYNEDLQTCWFAHDSVESLRWVWMSLNVWVVLSLLFLGAASIYIGVILSNERRNLLRSIARPVNMTAIPTTTFANEPKRYAQGLPQSLHIPPPGTTLSHPAATSPLRYELSMSRYPLQVGSTPAHSVGIRTGNGSGSGGGGNTCSSERSAMYAESKHGAPRTINSESATPQLLKSISATTGTQNRQKSRQISYGSLVRLAEFNDVLDTSIQSRPSMPHKQVHRSAKHMSLPLNTSNRAPAVGGNTHSYIAPRHVRQNSLPFEAPPGTTSGCSSANGIDKHYPHHIHDASGAATTGFSSANNLGPDYSNFSRQPRIHRNEEKTASVYLDSSETELHHDSGKFKAVLYYYADLVLSLASKICRRNTRPLSDFKEGRGRGAAGQIRRIEQRVHVLIATGALRVATRAMVPLITQLAMVVWSTSYSLGLLRASRGLLYTTAILMLSTQGLLGMMLYYIFDTQSDASTISLPSYMPHPEDSNNVSAAPQASHHAFVDGRSRRRVSQPNASATAAAHQSLSHLQNDVYYVPHASYERQKSHSQYKTSCSSGSRRCFCHTQQPPNRQQREPTHSQYRHYYNGMRMSLDQDNPLLVPRNCWGSKARAGSQQRSVSLGSVRTGDHNPLSNIEGLNIRRVDRTSNAMQSDTLNGSECVAWSHLDTQSTFDDASVSRFSTTAPLTQHHRPVLNGWEETDLEESDSLHPPHSS